MFKRLINFVSSLWHSFTSLFKKRPTVIPPSLLNEQEKHHLVLSLLKAQKNNKGLALHHVAGNALKDTVVGKGTFGAAACYSITPYIMGSALKEAIKQCDWEVSDSGEVCYKTNKMQERRVLDHALAVKIFDILHQKTLQYIQLNFKGNVHHFILIKEMDGATNPTKKHPTGQCIPQRILPSQIMRVFSKTQQTQSAERMLSDIEIGILELEKKASEIQKEIVALEQKKTSSIVAVLRAIHLGVDEKKLTKEGVLRRLVASEISPTNPWSDATYHQFYDNHGFFSVFVSSLEEVNQNLDHYKALTLSPSAP